MAKSSSERAALLHDDEQRIGVGSSMDETQTWPYHDDTSRSVNADSVDMSTDPHGLDNSRNSNISSLMNVLKGNLGTGILAMPVAVKNLGFLLGPLTILVIGCIATHCMHLLVKSAKHMRQIKRSAYLDYSRVTYEAVLLKFPGKIGLANVLMLFVNASLLITQIGFCCVYILFVSDNMRLVDHNLPVGRTNWDENVYKVLVMICLLPYVFVRNLRLLSYFSAVANLLTAIGLVIVFSYCVQDIPDYRTYPLVKPISLWPISFGLIIFAFEGISLVLPIESRMLRQQDFPGLTGVLQLGMTIVMSSYTAVGFYGYLKFNESVQPSITYSIDDRRWIYQAIRPLFAVALYISYGLQFYVPAVIIVGWAHAKLTGRWARLIAEVAIRIGLVLFTFLAAVVIPHLDLMISLIGAFSSSCLALIFPPIVDWLVFSDTPNRRLWHEVKNAFICLFGVIGFGVGTVTTLISIVDTFTTNPPISSNVTTLAPSVLHSALFTTF